MKINPVYGKEVKLRVRSIKFALTILFFNLILIAIALFGFEILFNVNWNSRIDYSGAAKVYFVITCLEAMMVAFLIPAFTAGSIAGEREKQTLEILLTTVLKPRQIITGKLMSSISMVLLLVVSSLPVISIVFTIGGISMLDLLQFVLAVFVFSLFIGSMGMLSSAMVKRTVPATVFSFALVFIVCVVTAIVVLVANAAANIYYYNVMNGVGKVPDVTWAGYLLLINPAFTMLQMSMEQYAAESMVYALGSGLNGHIITFVEENWFLCSMIVQLACTVVFVKLAAFFLDPLRKKKDKERKQKGKKGKSRKKGKSGDADEENKA